MTKITIEIDTDDNESKVTTITDNPKIDVQKAEPPKEETPKEETPKEETPKEEKKEGDSSKLFCEKYLALS